MPRPAKPYINNGHYVTTKGGKYRNLCPVADGFDRAVEIMNAAPAPVGPKLSDLTAKYLAHAKTYYRKNGVETATVEIVRFAMGSFGAFLSDPVAATITRAQLRDYRDSLVTEGLKRVTINKRIGWVMTAVAWMAENDYLPESVLASLRLLKPLRAGRSAAPDSVPVKPVAWSVVEACLPHLSPVLQDVVRLQWLTGMRPGEVLALRVDEIDGTTVDLGNRHKTAHKGRKRRIMLNPAATAIVAGRAILATGKNLPWVFPGRANRKLPYARQSYQLAVRKAAKRAGVPHWHPNQLRHAYATRVRAALGIEAAQLALGHASVSMTEVYAEQDDGLWGKIITLR